jgi:hypothetical protein
LSVVIVEKAGIVGAVIEGCDGLGSRVMVEWEAAVMGMSGLQQSGC